ncbi:RagB/SusD family nutrient uptake outer membrane protein [uncultured Muribaculum sp.]|uniref:RagB/SusD family nutrient uptake outer membrane protein n=1 Tax=uncultured Muribaculum sp. TaxID=1918613 RepID=UPI0025FCB990|nr:RagB/SusD family nutrient uptake outer membrane protein [uncultured Muribaculum sp.]
MFKYIKTALPFIAGAILMSAATSCSDSFFDLQPDDEVTGDKVYKTENDFELAVNACYSKLQTQMDFYIEMCEYRSDNLSLNAPTAGTQDRYDIDTFKETSANSIIDKLWENFYNGIYRCNKILDKIDGAEFDNVKKMQFKGEAMFVRALTFFNMYRAWGTVPVPRRVLTVAESLKLGRASTDEMYAYLAGDLEQIINENMLPDSYSGKDVGRATSGAAKALLAKVYLTFRQPQKAADLLRGMIGTYELLDNIADVFDVDNKMNCEVIFAVRYNKTVPGEGHGAWYSITNATDDNNRTETLKHLYDNTSDARAGLLEYVKVPGVNVHLMRKFYDTRDASTMQYGPDNILIRYADILLMYAEALNEVAFVNDRNSEALKALNSVHTRAGLPVIDIADIPSQDEFRKAVMLERQKEFPYEGHRWFDSVRLGGAKDAAAAEGKHIQDYQMLYPIPSSEIERINDQSLLWQNPGY